ncbi:MAG: hypothetical protein CVU71_07105 [Deltaproteobacteria bacterium HGW-Deltaproteobacteria-6]|jgi:hypothetical protein|nr:MAG: hypothetical protein CVU71_07105 [Deltaproteobacteria bacterium HGW-Deltaproteobacteria-6]
MIIEKSILETKMKKAYATMPLPSKHTKTPNLKWPRDIEVIEESGKITLRINENAIQSNMQCNVSAFEGWLLVLKEFVYKGYKFSVEFPKINKTNKTNKTTWQHYQRFLFRLSFFDSLYGKGSHEPWFELSDPIKERLNSDCLYTKYRNEGRLQSNIGKNGRGKGKDNPTKNLSELSETEIEWRLCKGGADKDCLVSSFNTGDIYRQFPACVFHDAVLDDNALFPGKKACVDLVADSGDEKSFWIFELKKKGNTPLGILSELLFYTAIVRDMIAGHVRTQKPSDKDCYDSTNLVKNKERINACFLAPDFHPLLIEPIINRLNVAFAQLKKRDNLCSVVFHKAILDIDKKGKLFVSSSFTQ